MAKRTKHITINLTEEEAELIARIAEDLERKPADLARLLMMREARKQWASMSIIEGGELIPNYKH